MEKRQLSLEKCTKISCKPCDMGYILKDYIRPIMQCLTNDIKDYHMRLLVTKCLNQAVMMSFFMLGKKGIEIANACDSVKVQQRHKDKIDNNTDVLEGLQTQLLYPRCRYRQMFYILMSDAQFNHRDGVTRHFPGHVFVIEKIPGGSKPSYYFHQSYINKYDYNGHIKRNNGLALKWDDVKRMIEQIRYVIMSPTWDANSVRFWKQITFVDTSNLLGAESGDHMFLCFRKARVSDCVGRLESYVRRKLSGISKLKLGRMNEVYGDQTMYDSDQKQLTNIQMKTSLEKLLETIQKTKLQTI